MFELAGDGGAKRLGALVGLSGKAPETLGKLFAQGARLIGIMLPHASDFFAEAGFGGIRRLKPGQQDQVQNYDCGQENEDGGGKHFCMALFPRILQARPPGAVKARIPYGSRSPRRR